MIKPIRDMIVVQVDKEEERSEGGLIIPDNAKEKQQRGTVISIGGDVQFIHEGDRILFGKYSGSEIEFERKSYLIFKEDDVLAVIA